MGELVLRGALVEYSGQFLGPIPNIVVFQFNPESIARTVTIPQRAGTAGTERPQRERGQAAAPPTETFTLTAHFSAADDLGEGGALSAIPRVFGIGPQLAALEKMVYPPRTPGGLIGAAIDAVASALSSGTASATRTVPREQVPRVLFIWGPTRVLPVTITSLTLTEQKYDFLLNPVQAEVQIGIAVASRPPDDDTVGKGALEYSNMIKDTQATLNLAKAVELALDIVPF
jgi:hypothetical protein